MPQSPRIRSSNHVGITAMTLAMACFVLNDSLVKHTSASVPGAQLIFLRGVCSTLLILAVAGTWALLRRGAPAAATPGLPALIHAHRAPLLWRSVLDALGTLAYLASLFHLPLGNAVAINSATPMVITVAAAWLLREHVSAPRWAAVVAGFAGVLLIVQPASEGFNAWALLCLGGTLLHTGRDMVTRRMPPQLPTLVVTLAAAATVTLAAGLLVLAGPWQAVQPAQMAAIAGASVFLSMAYFLIVMGMRHGDVSVVSPFRYTALLFALLLGWLVWGDLPNALAWMGIALMVGAGLFMLRRG